MISLPLVSSLKYTMTSPTYCDDITLLSLIYCDIYDIIMMSVAIFHKLERDKIYQK